MPFVYRTANLKPGAYPKHYRKSIVIAKSGLNLRSGPSIDFAASTRLEPNARLTLLGQHKDWLHVMTATGQIGFLNRKYVKAA